MEHVRIQDDVVFGESEWRVIDTVPVVHLYTHTAVADKMDGYMWHERGK